jgi:hypothetical protein
VKWELVVADRSVSLNSVRISLCHCCVEYKIERLRRWKSWEIIADNLAKARFQLRLFISDKKPRTIVGAMINATLSEEERHFYKCRQCREMVDVRQLDDVLFHEDHIRRPYLHYGGSEEI